MTDEMPEVWEDIPGHPGFQAGWDGNFRSLDRVTPSGRRLKGRPIPTRLSNKGYALVDLRDAEGTRVTRSAHSVILETFAGPRPEGMESRHYDDDGQNNRWRPGTEEESRKRGGNLFYGDKRQQYRDKIRNNNGTLPAMPPPSFDCINHAQCGGKAKNRGRRCVPCVEQVGRDAADMLRSGENLQKVAQRFGYTGTDWVYSLAVKHGRYRGTRADARSQRRRWSQRVVATIRDRLRRRDAVSRPPRAVPRSLGAKAGTAPFGRLSHPDSLGHLGHAETHPATQRERDQAPPLPADITYRNRPPKQRSGVTRRSRLSRRKGTL